MADAKAIEKHIKSNHKGYGKLASREIAQGLTVGGVTNVTTNLVDELIMKLNDSLGLSPLIFGLARVLRETFHMLEAIKIIRPVVELLSPLFNGGFLLAAAAL